MAATLVLMGEIWLWIGAVVAAIFLTIGIDRIDEDAQSAYVFRPLLIPGILLIWPLVLWRWWSIERHGDITMKRYQTVRRGHAVAAVLMSAAIVLLLGLSWNARQDWPGDIAPVQMTKGANE